MTIQLLGTWLVTVAALLCWAVVMLPLFAALLVVALADDILAAVARSRFRARFKPEEVGRI